MKNMTEISKTINSDEDNAFTKVYAISREEWENYKLQG